MSFSLLLITLAGYKKIISIWYSYFHIKVTESNYKIHVAASWGVASVVFFSVFCFWSSCFRFYYRFWWLLALHQKSIYLTNLFFFQFLLSCSAIVINKRYLFHFSCFFFEISLPVLFSPFVCLSVWLCVNLIQFRNDKSVMSRLIHIR